MGYKMYFMQKFAYFRPISQRSMHILVTGSVRVTGSIRVTGHSHPGRVGSRVSFTDPVPTLLHTRQLKEDNERTKT